MRQNKFAKVNRLINIMIDLADIADAGKGDFPYLDSLGMGCRALSGYIRQGVKDIIDLEHDYYNQINRTEYAESAKKEMDEFLYDIFGEEEAYTLNDDHKQKIREFVRGLMSMEDEE